MKILEIVFFYVFSFLVVLALHILIINRGRKTYTEGKKITEINYLVNKYNLDMRKIKFNNIKWATTIANSFIITTVATIVTFINGIIWQLLIGFVLLVILIIPVYALLGKHYQKIGGKDEHKGNRKKVAK